MNEHTQGAPMRSAQFTFANHLRMGGSRRLNALDKLAVLIRTDCVRQVGEMIAAGWDGKDAAQHYREWLLDWAAGTVEQFITEDLQT